MAARLRAAVRGDGVGAVALGGAANAVGGFQWPGITPVLIIPVVGNALAPLAGVPLGQHEWSAVQFGVGVFLWPVVLTLIMARIGVHGLWPDRLLPTGLAIRN